MQKKGEIQVSGLTAGYHKKIVLDTIDAEMPKGRITVVLGPNGSGKSTLLKSIAGLCRKMAGEIYISGRRMEEYTQQELAQKMFYLAQSHPDSSIRTERLVLHGRFPHLSYPRRYNKEDYQCCERAMRQVGIIDQRDKNLGELSGGERQKAYLAMALAGQTEVLLFDEPTTYLDIQYQTELFRLLEELRDCGRTVVAVLHDLDYALRLADWIVLLQDGNVVIEGSPRQVWESGSIGEVFHVKTGCMVDEEGTKHYYFG